MAVFRPKRCAIVLSGKYAGRKAVVLQAYDNGTKTRKYSYAIVAGVERPPQKVTKKMSEKKIASRTAVKTFVKAINYQHLLPTRFEVKDMPVEDLKVDQIKDAEKKKELSTQLHKFFTENYKAGKNEWLYRKLRF